MKLRSWLFVPSDSEKKLARAGKAGADVVILDLEDSVAPARKVVARRMAAEYLRSCGGVRAHCNFVRINPLLGDQALADLAATVGDGLDGIMLPKSQGAEDVRLLSAYLDALETRAGLVRGQTKIIALATETGAGMLQMQTYCSQLPRLIGLSWGAEDLSLALGAFSNRETGGGLSFPYRLAEGLCLIAASAANVAAIDAIFPDYRDTEGLGTSSRDSRRRGFLGRLAIHPDQVPIINASYSPTQENVERAKRIVEAFSQNENAGTVGVDGKMYDRPHLIQAVRTIASASDSFNAE